YVFGIDDHSTRIKELEGYITSVIEHTIMDLCKINYKEINDNESGNDSDSGSFDRKSESFDCNLSQAYGDILTYISDGFVEGIDLVEVSKNNCLLDRYFDKNVSTKSTDMLNNFSDLISGLSDDLSYTLRKNAIEASYSDQKKFFEEWGSNI